MKLFKTSLKRRLILSAAIMLAIFLFFAAQLIEQVYINSHKITIQDKLSAHVDTLLAIADDAENELWFPEVVREERFNRPDSDLWGYIWQQEKLHWSSMSTITRPFPHRCKVSSGEEKIFETSDSFYICSSFLWEFIDETEKEYVLVVEESKQVYKESLSIFRQRLTMAFIALGIALIVIQIFVLNWGLLPLKNISESLDNIQAGTSKKIEGIFPKEIALLTNNINELLKNQALQMRRYKDAASDLAHSLKTPLAVIRGELNKPNAEIDLCNQQIGRIDQIIGYQLQRALIQGHTTLQEQLQIKPVLEQVVHALSKVYYDKQISFVVECPSHAVFYGNEGDLMECLGNLLDNAAKFCVDQVKITIFDELMEEKLIRSLTIRVEDNGLGINKSKVNSLLKRGERVDFDMEGQGIGLAVISELVQAYKAELKIEQSQLGGAMFQIRFATQVYRHANATET
jgi:two-component system, OmpR family, sensor histidine kinase PhoQ